MKLSSMPTLARLALACSVYLDIACAMSRHKVSNFRNGISRAPPAVVPGEAQLSASYQNATFEQFIDHKNQSLGTFSQFYYYSDEFYKGPGSPVVSSALTRTHMALSMCIWL